MENLLLVLNSIRPLSPALEQHLRQVIKHKTFKKKEHLSETGKICRHMYFIKKGLLRCYLTRTNGEEVCTWLLSEMDIAVAVESFHMQIISEESIQALEDTEVFYISYDELEYIYDTFEEFNYHGRKLTTLYQVVGRQQYNKMGVIPATERYIHLLQTRPDLIRRVPAKHLASYLRIERSFLSKIKASLRKKRD